MEKTALLNLFLLSLEVLIVKQQINPTKTAGVVKKKNQKSVDAISFSHNSNGFES